MKRIELQKGWGLFLWGILLATFIGGAMRVYFSEVQLRHWISQYTKEQPLGLQLQFSRAHFSFSDGFLPRFAVIFNDVYLVSLNKCSQPWKLYTNEIVLPVSIWSWAKESKVRFKTIAFDQLKITQLDDCLLHQSRDENLKKNQQLKLYNKKEQMDSNEEPSWQKQAAVIIKKESVKLRRWLQEDYANSQYRFHDLVDGVTINQLKFFTRKNFLFLAEEASLRTEKNTTKLSGVIQFNPEVIGDQPLKDIRTHLTIAPGRVLVDISGLYKEGRIYKSLNYDATLNVLVLNGKFNYLPAHYLFKFLQSKEVLDFRLNPQWVWFNCTYLMKMPMEDLEKSHFKGEECGFVGDLVDIKADKIVLKPFAAGLVEPFSVNVKKIEIQKIFAGIDHTGPDQLLTNYGILSGQFDVLGLDQYKFRGAVEGVELYFSRKGNRGKQRIRRNNIELSMGRGRVSGLISDLDIEDGSFNGEMSFSFDKTLKNGTFQFSVDEIGLSNDVQEILVGGQAYPFSIYGKALVENGTWLGWEGSLGSKKIKGDGFSVAGVKVKAFFTGDELKTSWKVDSLLLAQDSEYFDLLMPILLDRMDSGEDLLLNDLELNVKFKKDEGSWSKSFAHLTRKNILLSSSGIWNKKGELTGAFHVDFPEVKLLKWDLDGVLSKPRLLPSRQLVEAFPGYIEKGLFSQGTQLEGKSFLKRIIKSDNVEKLKDAVKKFIPSNGNN